MEGSCRRSPGWGRPGLTLIELLVAIALLGVTGALLMPHLVGEKRPQARIHTAVVGEYIGIVLISALLVTLFFGGWHGPFGILPQIPFIWFALKTGFFIMLFILLRASIPRPRYDQVMAFSWKVCLPLTLINLLVTGALVLAAAQ